jgi:transcriptional activator SPT7
MDLGTMGRKLKAMLYNNKREFLADLQRIYNNCFAYNTDPVRSMVLCVMYTHRPPSRIRC